MSSLANPALDSSTLAHRLTSGKLPAPEALRLAMLLADGLRKLHDVGRCHGALTPSHIVLTGGGLDLLPAEEPAVTGPYTAPEVLQGAAPDQCGDIFSFGAILFEMLSGRRAFENGDTESGPPSSGSATVDKLLRSCLATDPSARYQRLQKLQMELKLLSVAVRRAETPASGRAEATDAALRTEMSQLEARLTTRLQGFESGLSAIEQGATAALAGLRNQLTAASAQLDTIQARVDDGSALRSAIQQFEARLTGLQLATSAEANSAAQTAMQQLENRLGARLQGYEQRLASIEGAVEAITGVQGQLSAAISQATAGSESNTAQLDAIVEGWNERMARLEHARAVDEERTRRMEASLETFERAANVLRESVTEDLKNYDKTLKAQAASLESARTAMAQTDDLVERVVEALESLQSTVLETAESAG